MFTDEYGVQYSDDKKTLVRAPKNLNETYDILDECENISDNAFEGCESVSYIGNAYNVLHIGQHVFDSCKNLKSISNHNPNYDLITLNPRRRFILDFRLDSISNPKSPEEKQKIEDLEKIEELNNTILKQTQNEINTLRFNRLIKRCEEVLAICQSKRIDMTTFGSVTYAEEPDLLQKATQMYYAYYADYIEKMLNEMLNKLSAISTNNTLMTQIEQLMDKDWNAISIENMKQWGNGWDAVHSVDIPQLVNYQSIKNTCWSYGDVKGVVYSMLEFYEQQQSHTSIE